MRSPRGSSTNRPGGSAARRARTRPTSTSARCASCSASTSRPRSKRRPTPPPRSPSCAPPRAELALRIATRGSQLALTQSGMVAEMLGGAELVEVSSDGLPGDKSRFVRAVEQAGLDGRADIGVHSAKDLPGEDVEGLEIAAVPSREDPADAWIGAGTSLEDIPEGARVGTVSLRRRAQLLAARPDLELLDLNGNVDTRLRKLAEGDYDAIVLAAAGLGGAGREGGIGVRDPQGPVVPGAGPRRRGREGEIASRVPEDRMVPAGGQGAPAVQVRTGDEETAAAVRAIGDE